MGLRTIALVALALPATACDLEASQRAFRPAARAEQAPLRARAAWTALRGLTPEPSEATLLGDDLDQPMGPEAGMVIPSACGACGCLSRDY